MRADFVSSISHELRTPLAQIKLYIETLRLGRAETPEKREWSLAHIDRETTRLGNLVENVLRFSRLGRAEEKAAAEAAKQSRRARWPVVEVNSTKSPVPVRRTDFRPEDSVAKLVCSNVRSGSVSSSVPW